MRISDWSADVCSSDLGQQNRLGTAAGLQAKERAPVKDQIEFHMAATTVSLEVALFFGEGHGPASFDDGHVGVHESIAYRTGQGEAMSKVLFVQVVEKQAAHAAGFIQDWTSVG